MPGREPKWAVGMRRLQPGFFVDAAGTLHVDEREALEAQGVAYTEENARTLRLAWAQAFGKDAEITVVEDDQEEGR